MNVLFVTPTDPRETSYGGQQRTHALWMGLKSIPGANVTTVVSVPHKKMESVDEQQGIYHLCFDRRYSPGWFLERLLRHIIPYCCWSFGYDWKRLHRMFADADIVIGRFIASVGKFKLHKMEKPLYLDADDIHTLEYDAETRMRGNSIKRKLVRYVLGKYQNIIYKGAHQIWLPAKEQLQLLEGMPATYLPNIPNEPLPDYSSTLGSKDRLLFVGYMCTDPNIVAVDWFLETFWNDVKRAFPKMEFQIVGGGLPERYRAKWGTYKDVKVLGRVDDIYLLYRDSLALVTPMRIGMGSCIKVLESLGLGRSVISTSQGLRGFSNDERVPAKGVFTFENLDGLISAIVALQDDRIRLGSQHGAKEFVSKRFSQTVINEIMVNSISKE